MHQFPGGLPCLVSSSDAEVVLIPADFRGSVEEIRAWISSLADRSVDCVIADPLGDGVSEDDFVAGMRRVWSVIYRVLRPTGTTWLILRDRRDASGSFVGLPWKSVFALQRDGWLLRNAMVAASPDDGGIETAFLLTKQSRYSFDSRAGHVPPTKNAGDVVFSTGDGLAMRCIAASCPASGTILDLFGDAGVANSARRLGCEVVSPTVGHSRSAA
jgi:hypothetical protein